MGLEPERIVESEAGPDRSSWEGEDRGAPQPEEDVEEARMEEKIRRLARWARGEVAPPISIEFHPTNLCNCDCIMCGTRLVYRRIAKEEENFSLRLVKSWETPDRRVMDLARESADLGVKDWLLTGGGEPMRRKEVTLPLMIEIKKLGMWGNINTNAALLTEQDVIKLVEIGWDKVMVSLDSHQGAVHDFLRQTRGAFDRASRALRLFQTWKRKLGVRKPKIIFNTVLFNRNCDDLDELIRFAGDVECSDITLIPLIKFDGIEKSLELSTEQRRSFQGRIDHYLEVARRSGVATNIESLKEKAVEDTDRMDELILSDIDEGDEGFAATPCFEPYLNLVIQMHGQTSPCCMLNTSDENIKDKSLEEIWTGRYFTDLRSQLSRGSLPEKCSTCVFSQVVHQQEIRRELRSVIER